MSTLDRQTAFDIYQGGYYLGMHHALSHGSNGRLTTEQITKLASAIAADTFDNPVNRAEIEAAFNRAGVTLTDGDDE